MTDPFGKTWNGRNATYLAAAFPASTLGLTTYSPATAWTALLAGTAYTEATDGTMDGFHNVSGGDFVAVPDYGLDTGTNSDGAVHHMVFDGSPNYDDVAVDTLKIVNPWVPDISAGNVATPSTLNAGLANSNSQAGIQKSWPDQVGADLVDQSDGSAVAGSNPSETKKSLGGWMEGTMELGAWQSDAPTS